MTNFKFYRLAIVALVMIVSFSSCEDSEVEKEKTCNENFATFQTEVEAYVEVMDYEEDEEGPTCEEFKAAWAKVTASYDDLCDEHKTTEREEAYAELTTASYVYAAFTECEL